MGNRLRGLMPAYKVGRLDEYILLRFGSSEDYLIYLVKRNWMSWENKQGYYKGVPVVATDLLHK